MLIGSQQYHRLFGLGQDDASSTKPGLKNFPARGFSRLQYEPSRSALQRHMNLTGVIAFDTDTFEATCELLFEAKQLTTQLQLNAKELVIESMGWAEWSGEWNVARASEISSLKTTPVAFTHNRDEVIATLSHALTAGRFCVLRIRYRTQNPKAGLYFVHAKRHSDAPYNCVWTQGQDVDSPFWFPCQDDPRLKMTTLITLTFPVDWRGVSNGSLVSEAVQGTQKTQQWALFHPHAPYLVAFAGGEFSEASSTWRTKPIQVLAPREFEKRGKELVSETAQMLEFYSNYWDFEYPWNKYSQAFVADFLYGGMENTTITINTDNVLLHGLDAQANDGATFLVMHEMAHQWFGDYVTCETWAEGWLNEGFATHSETLWEEHVHGKVSGIFYSLQNDKEWYLQEAQSYLRPMVCNDYEFVSEIFDGHLYSKGALVLNHLRDVIGEDAFRKSVGHYLRTNAFQPVRTQDLMRAVEQTTGWNPRAFFDTYVFRAGHIECDVSFKSTTAGIELNIEQKQPISREFPHFEFENFVHIAYRDGRSEEMRVQITAASQKVFLPIQGDVAFAIFDPRSTLVGRSLQKLSEEMCKAIFAKSDNAYFKFLATVALLDESAATNEHLELIFAAITNEKLVRARISFYDLLGASHSTHGLAEKLFNHRETHPQARIHWVQALGKHVGSWALRIAELLERLAESQDEVTLVRQAALGALVELSKNNSELRQEAIRGQLLRLAERTASQVSQLGLVQSGAYRLISEFVTPEIALKFAHIAHADQTPWRVRAGVLGVLAEASARFPTSRSELRPHLLRYATSLFPARLTAELPRLWVASHDSFYAEAFDAFIHRKNYGLLSMLIPRARRIQKQFYKTLETSAGFEKLSEVAELKSKLSNLEKELKLLSDKIAPQKDQKKASKKNAAKPKVRSKIKKRH